MLFCNARTQWNWLVLPMGGAVRRGLNYPGVRASRLEPIPDPLFLQIQVMESAVLEACADE